MVNKDSFKVQDKHSHDHLKDKSQEEKQGETEAPGTNILNESFEQKVNRAPDTEVDRDED